MELRQALRMAAKPLGPHCGWGTSTDACESLLMREVIAMHIGRIEECDVTIAHQWQFMADIQHMDEWEFISKVGRVLCECVEVCVSDAFGMSEAVYEACHGDYDMADAAAANVWRAVLCLRGGDKTHGHLRKADAVMRKWLDGCEELGWSLAYVVHQLRLLADGVRGIDLADHTCKLLMESNAYKV